MVQAVDAANIAFSLDLLLRCGVETGEQLLCVVREVAFVRCVCSPAVCPTGAVGVDACAADGVAHGRLLFLYGRRWPFF